MVNEWLPTQNCVDTQGELHRILMLVRGFTPASSWIQPERSEWWQIGTVPLFWRRVTFVTISWQPFVNFTITSLSNEETFIQDFLVIPKNSLQSFSKILKIAPSVLYYSDVCDRHKSSTSEQCVPRSWMVKFLLLHLCQKVRLSKITLFQSAMSNGSEQVIGPRNAHL